MHWKLLREMSRTGGGHTAGLVAEPGGVARLCCIWPGSQPLASAGSWQFLLCLHSKGRTTNRMSTASTAQSNELTSSEFPCVLCLVSDF